MEAGLWLGLGVFLVDFGGWSKSQLFGTGVRRMGFVFSIRGSWILLISLILEMGRWRPGRCLELKTGVERRFEIHAKWVDFGRRNSERKISIPARSSNKRDSSRGSKKPNGEYQPVLEIG